MFLVIDKPKGITSHDVVYQLRKITGVKKIGHGGTLDPNATGLLILGVGRQYTKKLQEVLKNLDKTYEATIFLGKTTDTLDAKGNITKEYDVKKPPTKSEVLKLLASFIGKQSQTPPIFSAIKLGGRKAYQMARKGEKLTLKPRKIEIYDLKLITYKYPTLKIVVKVTSGTYIRSLAFDIGEKLKTGGYLKDLRRVRIGAIAIEKAVVLNKITASNWQSLGKETL